LKYIASKSISKANSLSKKVDWAKNIKRDNKNQMMLKKKWLKIKVIKKQFLIKRAKKKDY